MELLVMAPIAPNKEVRQSSSFFDYVVALSDLAAAPAADSQGVFVEVGAPVSVVPATLPKNLNLFNAVHPFAGEAQAEAGVRVLQPRATSDFNSKSADSLMAMQPQEYTRFVTDYHIAQMSETFKRFVSNFPTDVAMPLKQVLGALPEEFQESLAPLAHDPDVTLEMTREKSPQNELGDAVTGVVGFGTYRLIIRHKGLIVSNAKQLPGAVKSGLGRVFTDPAVHMAGIKILGMGVVYICLDRQLANMGIPDYARGPTIMGLHFGGRLSVDALGSLVTGNKIPWAGYGQALGSIPGYYLSYKGASYLLNEVGLEANGLGNQLGSFGLSYVATKPTLKGLSWATQYAVSGLSRLGSLVTSTSASFSGAAAGRSLAARWVPLSIALVGKMVGTGLLAGAAKFLGKAKNVVNPAAWGLLAMDLYYAVKDGHAEGLEKEFIFARDSLLAEEHSGISNFFLGSLNKATTSDEAIERRRAEIKGQLKDRIDNFDNKLWVVTASYVVAAKKFDRQEFARHLETHLIGAQTSKDIAGMKQALEDFTSLGADRYKILDYITSDNQFDGTKLATYIESEVAKNLLATQQEFDQALRDYKLAAFDVDGKLPKFTELSLGELTPEARQFLLGSSTKVTPLFLRLRNEIAALGGVKKLLEGQSYALTAAEKSAL